MKFRTTTIEDAAFIAQLGLKTFSQAFRDMNDPAAFDAYVTHAFATEKIASELRDPRSEFILAFPDGCRRSDDG